MGAVTVEDQSAALPIRAQALNLFLTGFLVLFLELASIRWFSANVIFLHYFTNVVLLACFVGMSCGCLAARQHRDWLGYFPALALLSACMAMIIYAVFTIWSGLDISVGHQVSPQEIFFGTEDRNVDVAKFTVPIDLIVDIFFVMIALTFVGLGQVLGRAFDTYPNRVLGYTLNIGGSLVGIIAFSLLSFFYSLPIVWYFLTCAGVAYLLYQVGNLTFARSLMLFSLLVAVTVPATVRWLFAGVETFWSPYYAVEYYPPRLGIFVDNVGHQQMVPFGYGGSVYSLIHLLRKGTGGPPFQDELIIGAGSGNDIDHALHYGVGHIDAVEIDPVIQNIGINYNPDRPYADPRVIRYLDDGRHFLRTTAYKYDLVVYALVDSLILHSSYSNIRLESYLFTEEAFQDIKRVLKPGGIFITYNFFRQGWLVERIAAMAEGAFGCKPIVLSLPYRKTLRASELAGTTLFGFNVIITDCDQTIGKAFAAHKTFWLNTRPVENTKINGFTVQPELLSGNQAKDWQKIAPTTLIHDFENRHFTTDDWPFLYVRDKMIPELSIRSMIELGVLGIAMVYFFIPKGRGLIWIDWRMFCLGAAFMLLETKAVVQLALLFGSTWLVNSLVFFTALILILLANLYVLKAPPVRLIWHYAGLMSILLAAIAVPLDLFLSGGIFWRYAMPCMLALGPMFFAGVIFARFFRDSDNPDVAFGSNIAGSVVGGLCESFSMLLGFRYLLLFAALFYLLSFLIPSRDAKIRLVSSQSQG